MKSRGSFERELKLYVRASFQFLLLKFSSVIQVAVSLNNLWKISISPTKQSNHPSKALKVVKSGPSCEVDKTKEVTGSLRFKKVNNCLDVLC